MDRSGPSANAKPRKELWRDEYDKLGRRPRMQEVDDWYNEHAERIWGPEKPSLEATRDHAKCLRSKKELREYFQRYNAKKQLGRPFNDLRQCRGNRPRSGGGGSSSNQPVSATAANSSQSPRSSSDPGGGGGGGGGGCSGAMGSYDGGCDGATGGAGAQEMYGACTMDMMSDGGLDQPLRSRDSDVKFELDGSSPQARFSEGGGGGGGVPDGFAGPTAILGTMGSSVRGHEALGPLGAAVSAGEDALALVRSGAASPISHGSDGGGGGGAGSDRLNAARHHPHGNHLSRANGHINGNMVGGFGGPKPPSLRSGDGGNTAEATDAGAAAARMLTGNSAHCPALSAAAAAAENVINLDSQMPYNGGSRTAAATAANVTTGSTPPVFSDSRPDSHRTNLSRPPPAAAPSTLTSDGLVPRSYQAQAPHTSHSHRFEPHRHHKHIQPGRVNCAPAASAEAVASGCCGGGCSGSGAAAIMAADEEEVEEEDEEAVGGDNASSGATESYPSNLALVSRWLAGIAASALKKRVSIDYTVDLAGAAASDRGGDVDAVPMYGGGSGGGNGDAVNGKEPEATGVLDAAWRRAAGEAVSPAPAPPQPALAHAHGEDAAPMEHGDAESYGEDEGVKAEEDASRLANVHLDLDVTHCQQQQRHHYDSPCGRSSQDRIPGPVTGTATVAIETAEAEAVQLARRSSGGGRREASGHSGGGAVPSPGGGGGDDEEPSPLGPREPSLSDLPQSPLAVLATAVATDAGVAAAAEAALPLQLSFRSSDAFTGCREETDILGSGSAGGTAAGGTGGGGGGGGGSLSAGSKRAAAAAAAALELLGVPSLRASVADDGFPDTPHLHRPQKLLRLETGLSGHGRSGGSLSQRPSVASSGAAITGSAVSLSGSGAGNGGSGGIVVEPPPRPPPPPATAAGGIVRAPTPVPGVTLPPGSPPDPFRTPMFQRSIGREGLGGAHLGGGGGEGGSCNLAPSVLQARESVCMRGTLPLPPAGAVAAGTAGFLLPQRESLSARGSMPPPLLLLPPRPDGSSRADGKAAPPLPQHPLTDAGRRLTTPRLLSEVDAGWSAAAAAVRPLAARPAVTTAIGGGDVAPIAQDGGGGGGRGRAGRGDLWTFGKASCPRPTVSDDPIISKSFLPLSTGGPHHVRHIMHWALCMQ
ncbi:hypothetical protein VOLCADRAFT_88018 [Volvox carteri f. nagariensis]|uniref:Uncharacterized protein n=1 Tax=Volvox carteri f. nagariensis TaxID=3068 RepID=D8TMV0_VOLCA|nr:uncharacterized protein VOLCADRAFT_88018 [Volvox carteri f. nagariensis]EFJ51318.1 hypothetical protein VOLCADRAFT_88018 [Volvox carteri f. nagariensis]|eukprot:XP_002947785.1 hypothetical protein VOLCADRAFT_88018 [Volvox carteri f. nagariensis]